MRVNNVCGSVCMCVCFYFVVGGLMTSNELRKELESRGCRFLRQGKGSHEIWINKKGYKISVPHPKKKMGKGLITKLLKWAED